MLNTHVWFVFESLLLSFYKEWDIDHVEIQLRVHKCFIPEMPTPEVEGLKALTNQLRCWSCHLSFLTKVEIYQIFLFILAEAICLVAKWFTYSIHSSYIVNLKIKFMKQKLHLFVFLFDMGFLHFKEYIFTPLILESVVQPTKYIHSTLLYDELWS